LGVALGLLVGKPLGVLGMTWLAVRTGLGQLPSGVAWKHILGVGFLAGIGFTVAIFVGAIAFGDPALVDQAKMGIFGASLLAGAAGYLFLRFTSAHASDPST
jgi:NhaA family Na+:H+ antiporter